MRTLTEAEARVVGSLLASNLVSERERLRRAEVPRSTYHAARRRAYAEGWLRDRYVPNPVEFGWPFVSISLVRPFADHLPSFLDVGSSDPSTVFLEYTPQLALTVGLHPDRASAEQAARRAGASGDAGWSYPLVADLRGPGVPVYFDFEGSFAHLGEGAGPEGYPQGLGGSSRSSDRPEPELRARRSLWGALELAHRPFGVGGDGRPPHLIGPLGLPWGQQKLLNQGWMRHRVLLDPAKLPPIRGRRAEQQVFVTGTLRPDHRAEELFRALTQEARVFPFFFVTADRGILIGAIGRNPSSSVPLAPPAERPSVMGILRERVEGIEILQDPVEVFQLAVDHRYDRLFPRPSG